MGIIFYVSWPPFVKFLDPLLAKLVVDHIRSTCFKKNRNKCVGNKVIGYDLWLYQINLKLGVGAHEVYRQEPRTIFLPKRYTSKQDKVFFGAIFLDMFLIIFVRAFWLIWLCQK